MVTIPKTPAGARGPWWVDMMTDRRRIYVTNGSSYLGMDHENRRTFRGFPHAFSSREEAEAAADAANRGDR